MHTSDSPKADNSLINQIQQTDTTKSKLPLTMIYRVCPTHWYCKTVECNFVFVLRVLSAQCVN